METFISVLFGVLYFAWAVVVLYIASLVWSNATLIYLKVSRVTQFLYVMVKKWIRFLLLKVKLIRFTSIPELELNDIEIPSDCFTKKETAQPTLKKRKSGPRP